MGLPSLTGLASLTGLGFPESLRWRDDELWFSDMFRSRVVRWRPGSAPETVLDRGNGAPEMPGGLGWMPDGTLLLVDCLGRRILRVDGASVQVHVDLTSWMTHLANDLHVDSDGTAWVGGYGFDPEADAPRAAPLLRVGADGTITRTSEEFVFANGCERDADGALLVAETFADRVTSLAADGSRRLRARFAPGSGPDGLSVGHDGALYVALAFTGALAEVGDDGTPRVIHRPGPAPTGALGVYDCAVHPDGRVIAVALASLDEAEAQRTDTGRIDLLELPQP